MTVPKTTSNTVWEFSATETIPPTQLATGAAREILEDPEWLAKIERALHDSDMGKRKPLSEYLDSVDD